MEATQQEKSTLNPELLLQLSFSLAPSSILSAALTLDVFTHISAGNRTVEEIARAAGASERGMRMLLDALVALQLLSKDGEQYGLTPLSAEFLVRDSQNYIGEMLRADRTWQAWSNLAEVVRTGEPLQAVEAREKAEEFFPMLVRGLHVINTQPARRTAEILGAGVTHNGMKVLDVACGSGIWGISIAEADRDAHVTAQDFPGLFETTRGYLKRHDVEDRYDFLPGDLKEVDFGENRYDLALLGNIVHSEGEESSRSLFKRLYGALKPGGRIVIIDMIPNDERTGPPFPLFFAINMLLNTEKGSTYTLAEYTEWLSDAGFKRVETADIQSHSPIIIGYKD
ncbi:MAG: methyltransferase domain-containing protein [Acidobacteriota bacterium]|nr:methyltransferase domain-containing protein [Acidobacteriota bacterium]